MSPKDTSLEEEEGVDVGRVEQDGVGWEGGVESYSGRNKVLIVGRTISNHISGLFN